MQGALFGLRFGRLQIVACAEPSLRRQQRVLCQCDCGTRPTVHVDNLKRGLTKSCGCLRQELGRSRIRHGSARRGCVTSEHRAWQEMHARCTNANLRNFHRYGGRGISVCEHWAVFENFLSDMGHRPPRTSLDRIDNDGNYEPGNCRWADAKTQARNTRSNRIIEWHGISKPISAWAEELGIHRGTLTMRLRNGWSVERAFTCKAYERALRPVKVPR